MGKAFKIVENGDIIKSKYPDLPFVIKDGDDKYLVFYDDITNKYRYILLDNGKTTSGEYDTLDEMFNINNEDVILETELVIKGLYK